MPRAHLTYFLVLCFSLGCSSSDDFQVAGADSATDEDTGTDGTVVDAQHDGVADALDVGDVPVDPCDPTEKPDPTLGVFASVASGNDKTGDGSATLPFKTIAAALNAARAAAKSLVYLDVGTYPESIDFVDSNPGIFVQGGWKATGASWTRNCSPTARAETIAASPDLVAVKAVDVKHLSGLDRLTVATKAKGASAHDASGESLTGVFVSGDGTVFALRRVSLVVGDGGNGGAATGGAPGAGPISCTGVGDCSTGAPGTAGANGPSAPAGSFGTDGYVAGDGAPGLVGANGANGTAGGAGQSSGCVTGCAGVCDTDSCLGGVPVTTTAPSGKCGCGGAAGAGGAAGRGGGSAVGLYVVGKANVDISNTTVRVGKGGDGSVGGGGGSGAAGSGPSAGTSVTCATGGCHTVGPHGACYCGVDSTPSKTLTGGTAGGAGGTGAVGGAGGGGSGGSAFDVVTVGGGKAVIGVGCTIDHGAEGKGATGAPDGKSGDENDVP